MNTNFLHISIILLCIEIYGCIPSDSRKRTNNVRWHIRVFVHFCRHNSSEIENQGVLHPALFLSASLCLLRRNRSAFMKFRTRPCLRSGSGRALPTPAPEDDERCRFQRCAHLWHIMPVRHIARDRIRRAAPRAPWAALGGRCSRESAPPHADSVGTTVRAALAFMPYTQRIRQPHVSRGAR